MNTSKKTAIAIALAMAVAAPVAMAQSEGGGGDVHSTKIKMVKKVKLTSDVAVEGKIKVKGEINPDSAAIAIIDNQQHVHDNKGENTMLDNEATIGDGVASDASGNLGFNVAAGDNNTQDNAVALSAADASFAFGMADAEVFVKQAGRYNTTENYGVTNNAGVSGNAFQNASGNIGVNVTSGNNNEQKNALAAAVATTAMAQSSVSSDQVSSNNRVRNSGYTEDVSTQVQVALSGDIRGNGTYSGSGNSYQSTNFYPDTWRGGTSHPGGSQTGHDDWDSETQGAVQNPNKPGVGGIGFDNVDSGELDFAGLASLTGTVTYLDVISVDATNTASLSGNAFGGASGNIGVNVSSGTGNLQANSLAMAVAQPSSAGGGGGGGE